MALYGFFYILPQVFNCFRFCKNTFPECFCNKTTLGRIFNHKDYFGHKRSLLKIQIKKQYCIV